MVVALLSGAGSIGCGESFDEPADGGTTTWKRLDCGSGKTSMLAENFDSGVFPPLWEHWEDVPEAEVALEEGQAVLRLSTDDSAYAGIESREAYDLTECAVSVEVLEVPNADEGADAILGVGIDINNGLFISASQGDITFQSEIADTIVESTSQTYSLTYHRFWRIRETGGTVYFEVSGDGMTWSEALTAPTPDFATAAEVSFQAGSWEATTSPGRAVIDNVNYLP